MAWINQQRYRAETITLLTFHRSRLGASERSTRTVERSPPVQSSTLGLVFVNEIVMVRLILLFLPFERPKIGRQKRLGKLKEWSFENNKKYRYQDTSQRLYAEHQSREFAVK